MARPDSTQHTSRSTKHGLVESSTLNKVNDVLWIHLPIAVRDEDGRIGLVVDRGVVAISG
eukprot:m.159145 g.159145  ORF g.159145 m.159145 type:complete len:60 (+) comp23728_c1_seq2:41-220(+)